MRQNNNLVNAVELFKYALKNNKNTYFLIFIKYCSTLYCVCLGSTSNFQKQLIKPVQEGNRQSDTKFR